jgi:PadR family transcriptional regulator AphA
MADAISPLRGALLGLVARGPSSGYDLAKMFAGTVGNVWGASHSVIYPELVSMESDGLLTVAKVGRRGRKPYVLTRKGEAALRAWLLSKPRRSAPRSDALLRTFFLGFLEREQAERFIDSELQHHRQRLAAYQDEMRYYRERLAAGCGDPEWWTGGLTLELGIRNERMMVQWYEWVREQLAPARTTTKPEPKKRSLGRARA